MSEITWVIIEVTEVNGVPRATPEPATLKLPYDWSGTIVWYVFTPNYELNQENGVVLPDPFSPLVGPDPARPGCWSATVLAKCPGSYSYGINYHRVGDVTNSFHHDPVIENDPPPTPSLIAERKKQQRRVAAAASH